MMRAAGVIVRFGITDRDVAYRLLRDEYGSRCNPPWTDPAEINHKLDDALKLETRRDLVGWTAGKVSQGQAQRTKANLAPDDPHRLGKLYLKSHCEHQGLRTLVYHRAEFHVWKGSAYRPAPDHEINGQTANVSRREFDRLNKLAIKLW
jgi:hypothetical protein